MTPELNFKNAAISYLSRDARNIDTYPKLDDFLKEGEYLQSMLINEINNNQYVPGLEYKEYLNELTGQLWRFFQKSSYQTKNRQAVEHNLLTYYLDYQKYNEKFNTGEYQAIYDLGKDNLELEAIESFEDLFSVESNKYRKIGELPYTSYKSDHLTNYYERLGNQGLLDKLHRNIDQYDNPSDVKDCVIRNIYLNMLLFSTEQIRTNFLWIIIGKLISQLQILESKHKTIEHYFKDPNDYSKITAILRDKAKVIGNNNSWLGVPIRDDKTKMTDIDKTNSAIIALIECLEIKHYLKKSNQTGLGRAFCKAFNIVLSERGMRRTPNKHQIYFAFFSEKIPDRSH